MPKYDLAKEIIRRAVPDAKLVSQAANLWQGDFRLPETVAEYYRELGACDIEIENYGDPLFLPSLARLWDYQTGYRFHGLTKARIKDWNDDWLVIADSGANPFIYSRAAGEILFAQHGQGKWQSVRLFADLPEMILCFALLGETIAAADEDSADEDDDNADRRLVAAAKERLNGVLHSEAQAELLLMQLGWLE